MTKNHLRVLAVQSSSLLTSEVSVLHTLLENVQGLAQKQDVELEVLLVQGIDVNASSGEGRDVASLFARIPNVTVHEMPTGKLGRHDTPAIERALKVRDLVRLQRSRARLLKVAREFQPDLVYSNQQYWDLRVATPLAHSLGCPQVVHLHYTIGPWLGRNTVETLQQADMVITVSDYICDDAVDNGVPAERVYPLYNSIVVPPDMSPTQRAEAKRAFSAELAIPENSLLVGMTARLNPYKGQEELVRAMLPILQSDRRVHVLLAGSENPAGAGVPERITLLAQAHDVVSQVHLLGQRTDVPRILDVLDVFSHPSRRDPCPLAVLEASAHGLPVVAWREGGTAKLILDQDTGLLVQPMDIEGLTRALETLITDGPLRKSMGQKARARAATVFRPEIAASSFLSLLQSAAHTRDRLGATLPASSSSLN